MTARTKSNYKRQAKKFFDNAEKTAVRRAFKRVKPVALDEARENVPVDSGALRDILDVQVKRSRGETRLRIGFLKGEPASRYAGVVELGTEDTRAQPFLRPTLRAIEDMTLDIVIEEMNRVGNKISRSAESL